jgi:hypothetical protein
MKKLMVGALVQLSSLSRGQVVRGLRRKTWEERKRISYNVRLRKTYYRMLKEKLEKERE